MPRSSSLPRDRSLLPFIESCNNLSSMDREVLKLFMEGAESPWNVLGIPKTTYYYRLRKAYDRLKQCLAGEVGGSEKKTGGRRRRSGEAGATRTRDPDKAAVQQSLKEVASVVGKWSAEQMKEVLEIGIAFYNRFRYIHEVLGIPWETLIDILYKVYMEHRDEIEIPYLELFEHELMNIIAEALEEIQV